MLAGKSGLVQVTFPFFALGALFMLSGCDRGGATGQSSQEKGGTGANTSLGKKDTPAEPTAPAKSDEKKIDAPTDPYPNLYTIRPPYEELFAVSSKIKLDDKQKEKLAELRMHYEPKLLEWAKQETSRDVDPAINAGAYKRQLMRKIVRERNAILTEEQREAAGIKTVVPVYATEKA
jgi:hypothetical protein